LLLQQMLQTMRGRKLQDQDPSLNLLATISEPKTDGP